MALERRQYEDIFGQKTNLNSQVSNAICNPFHLPTLPRCPAIDGLQRLSRSRDLYNALGTTKIGFKYQDGIVLGADARITITDSILADSINNVVELDKNMLCTAGAGDGNWNNYWKRAINRECNLHQMQHGEPSRVSTAARFLTNDTRNLLDVDISKAIMYAGYDPDGAKLICVDANSEYVYGNKFEGGSGDSPVMTYHKWNMTDMQAYRVARDALYNGIPMERCAGGLVRACHGNPFGWKDVSINDCVELYDLRMGFNGR